MTDLKRYMLNGPTMGSRFSAVFYAAPDLDTAPLGQALADAAERVEQQMSTFRPSSDLNRINRAAIGEWLDIPTELTTVLARALEIGELSGGVFNIGVGDIVTAWGFGAGRGQRDQANLSSRGDVALRPVARTLELRARERQVRKLAPLTLDLSGIAKGFGVDELGRVMDAFGHASWLVGIDGEMAGRGLKPDGSPWAVAHERPERGIRTAMGVLELSDAAVATSGNYRHFIDVDGKSLSHTVDPRSGRLLEGGLASATVLARSCMDADAWATVLMVLGEAEGLALAERLGMKAILVSPDLNVVSTL
ncbi:FAD:protein FMN transferase [Oryzibacter oryziterrae]|uniref:FAD:protein FMN transferase n=1 Tax=Oryzibacter oryziterrae TaxID=2766474 RepID=UPI001F30281C|nr:FAD:protein FMN transferase [Oryzibacter oryziterrae]